MASPDAENQRKIGICEGCGKAAVVWVPANGAIRPVSGHNVCACTDASFRAVDGDTSVSDTI